jgi:bidirectional [NiFe] hydrogenase diaphorase subunit
MIRFTVDDKELEIEEGPTLLEACLDNGIYIPNLCYIKGMTDPPSSCRMCFVELDGEDSPVTSCSIKAKEGMVVRTNTPLVRRLQTTAMQLLLSVHCVECGKCPANKKCELQGIAKFLKIGLKQKKLSIHLKSCETDSSHPYFNYHPNRCVLCGRCVYTCKMQNGFTLLTFAKRGLATEISFYGQDDPSDIPCSDCLACIEICPVAALTKKEDS